MIAVHMMRNRTHENCGICGRPARYRIVGDDSETFSCYDPQCYSESHNTITEDNDAIQGHEGEQEEAYTQPICSQGARCKEPGCAKGG